MSPQTVHFILSVVCVGVGGFVGASARFLVVRLAQLLIGGFFPWGSLIVNSIGCFLAGLVVPLILLRGMPFPEEVRLMVIVGFTGAFTTYSAFSLDTMRLFDDGHVFAGFMNIIMNVVVSILAVYIGAWLCRLVLSFFE